MVGHNFLHFATSYKHFNISTITKVNQSNKRYLTKDISKSTSKVLDFLSDVPKVKYKGKFLTKNWRSKEAIKVQLDMFHMHVIEIFEDSFSYLL